MLPAPRFLFASCQIGAETALKSELARRWPDFRFSYSRPGYLTFKLPDRHGLADDVDLESTFARAYGFSLAKIASSDLPAAVDELAQAAAPLYIDQLHVWQRDSEAPGRHGYEPALAESLSAVDAALRPRLATALRRELPSAPAARPGQRVLDCVEVQPGEWWIGYHRARPGPSCLPGGLDSLTLPDGAVSRAYLKMEEALCWADLPIRPGERVAELGCAPGGSCQALLARGLVVTGVDPADVDPAVIADPNFTHVRKRGAEVRRREFRKTRWLTADMNVAPRYTLDTVEAIVMHPEVDVRGMILTLKLLDWRMADELPTHLERIRAWGYPSVRARQLQHGRQEVCVMATRAHAPFDRGAESGRARGRDGGRRTGRRLSPPAAGA